MARWTAQGEGLTCSIPLTIIIDRYHQWLDKWEALMLEQSDFREVKKPLNNELSWRQ